MDNLKKREAAEPEARRIQAELGDYGIEIGEEGVYDLTDLVVSHGMGPVKRVVDKALNSYTKGNDPVTLQMSAPEYIFDRLKRNGWNHNK